MASEQRRREMVDALEQVHQQEWHAAAAVAARKAASRAQAHRLWEEQKNLVSVATLLAPSADHVTGEVDTWEERRKRRMIQRSPRRKMAPTVGQADVHCYWDAH